MRRIITNTLLVLISLFIALIICEAGLRLLGIDYVRFYDYDPYVGAKLRPGFRGYWLEEGGGYVSINSDGLRDREHTLVHPPNTLRIAVLGDSYAEAKQVNREQAFWAVMEKRLQGCGNLDGRQIEVINFGQSGLGTAQELLVLRHRVWKYSPDVVLLAFFTGNDIADNYPAFMQWAHNPYFSFQDGKLVLNDRQTRERWLKFQKDEAWIRKVWKLRAKRWLEDNSRIFQLLSVKAGWFQISKKGQTDASHKGPEPGLLDDIYRKSSKADWQEAWKVTEALILMMRDEVVFKGARFFVVVLTNSYQVHPDPEWQKNKAQELGVQDLSYPDHRLEKFCQREGIPILLLLPGFQKYATEHKVFLHGFKGNLGFGHWNQNGHLLAGKMLAEWLCRQLN